MSSVPQDDGYSDKSAEDEAGERYRLIIQHVCSGTFGAAYYSLIAYTAAGQNLAPLQVFSLEELVGRCHLAGIKLDERCRAGNARETEIVFAKTLKLDAQQIAALSFTKA